MQGKTIRYQMGLEQWKIYFGKFARKTKYVVCIVLSFAVFAAVAIFWLRQIIQDRPDTMQVLLFALFVVIFLAVYSYLIYQALPGTQAARYVKQLQQHFKTKTLHYAIRFEQDQLVYGAQESKDTLAVPYGSIRLLDEKEGMVRILARMGARPASIVVPAKAVPGGARALADFLSGKNPNCKVEL